MEDRVAKLEADVSAIKIDVATILSNYATKSDVQGLRAEMKAEFGALRTEVAAEIGALRTEAAAEFGVLRTGIAAEFGSVRVEIESLRTTIFKSAAATQKWMLATVIGLFIGFGGLVLGMSNAFKPASAVVQAQPQLQSQLPPIVINIPAPQPSR